MGFLDNAGDKMGFLETVIDLIIAETSRYLEKTGRENSFARFPYLRMRADRVTKERLKAAEQSQEIQAVRYQALLARLSGGSCDAVIQTVTDLALAAMQVPEFAAYLNYYTGARATLQLAYEMLGVSFPDCGEVKERRQRLKCAFDVEENPLPAFANVDGNQELLSYLTGDDSENPMMEEWAEWFFCGENPHPMYVRGALAEAGADMLAAGNAALQIAGRGGRRFLAKHIAVRLNRDLLFIPTDVLRDVNEDAKRRQAQAVHEAFLYGSAVCIYGICDEASEQMKRGQTKYSESVEFYRRVVRPFSAAGVPVLLCTDFDVRFLDCGNEKIPRLEITALSRKEREQVFAGFAEQYGFPESPARCALRYRLNASEIAEALSEWSSLCGEKGERQSFSESCYRVLLAGGEAVFGQILKPQTDFEELMVPPQMRRTLEEICCGAAEGYRVYEEWNLARLYPYGWATSVLMAGPPGTGKTMTAHALAHELDLPLYRVDLSGIMDKYIGETEKHLEQVFAFAEKTNLVLFFDEADALFGRRGEVTEGKDRYANMEVAYILQRIERFDGIVLLATNFYHNIDKAFLRRMKYVLKYQEPDEALRRAIWESCLAPKLPKEVLDVGYLAKQFEMSGGMIKNVIQNACVAALYEGKPLGMTHLLRSIRMEYEKMERNVTADLWGEYAYLME